MAFGEVYALLPGMSEWQFVPNPSGSEGRIESIAAAAEGGIWATHGDDLFRFGGPDVMLPIQRRSCNGQAAMQHWMRAAQVCLVLLILVVSASPAPANLAVTPTRRPAPASTQPVLHEPAIPNLPIPNPHQPRAFRLAAHTLFLDSPVAELASQAGFDTIVQVFPWRDLNPRPDYFRRCRDAGL